MEFTLDTGIALAALLTTLGFGVHSVLTSRRLNKLQERVTEYELRAHEEAEEWARRGDLRVRLERGPDQIVLWNEGGAEARDVRLKVTSRNGAPDPIERDARRKLPLPRLTPHDQCSFSALVLWEHDPAFDVAMTWRDPDGRERHAEQTLYG